jgi:tRNA(adenine34) deaminase
MPQNKSEDQSQAEHFMNQALAVAADGLAHGELPIGAVIVSQGQVIASAYTQEKTQGRFLVHADLLAIEAADRLRPFPGKRRDATLYVNLEPCLMCLGAAMSAFIGHICFGLESPADGAVNLVQNWKRAEQNLPGYRTPTIRGGVLREKTIDLFRQYVQTYPTGPMSDWAKTLISSRH